MYGLKESGIFLFEHLVKDLVAYEYKSTKYLSGLWLPKINITT